MEARGASAQVVVVWNAMCAAASFENQDVLKALEPYGANVAYDFHGYETFLRYAARHAPCCCDAARPRRDSAAQCHALGRGPLCGVLQHSLTRAHASLPPPWAAAVPCTGAAATTRGQQGLLTRHYHGWVLWSR
jgi:hypothetical protein